jgi:hypothetical protein
VLGLVVVLVRWPGVTEGFSAGYRWVANHVLLDHVTFGAIGRARFRAPTSAEFGTGRNVETDAVMVLRLEGFPAEQTVSMSVRRDAYLPLAIFIVTVLPSPLSWRRKARCLAIGTPVMFLLVLGCLWLATFWIFTREVPVLFNFPARDKAALDFFAHALLMPPDNRFLVPLVLAIGLCLWQSRRPEVAAARVSIPLGRQDEKMAGSSPLS